MAVKCASPDSALSILPHLGEKYDRGLYRVEQTWLYTNRGIGMIAVPLRLNCRPEITEITLSRA
jgi:predicted MPP superfamily phosphohydrolase